MGAGKFQIAGCTPLKWRYVVLRNTEFLGSKGRLNELRRGFTTLV
jgi:hypothetical protein